MLEADLVVLVELGAVAERARKRRIGRGGNARPSGYLIWMLVELAPGTVKKVSDVAMPFSCAVIWYRPPTSGLLVLITHSKLPALAFQVQGAADGALRAGPVRTTRTRPSAASWADTVEVNGPAASVSVNLTGIEAVDFLRVVLGSGDR